MAIAQVLATVLALRQAQAQGEFCTYGPAQALFVRNVWPG